jgi:hypothetical protein
MHVNQPVGVAREATGVSEVGGSHQTGDPAGTRHWARKRGTSESELVAFWNVETWTGVDGRRWTRGKGCVRMRQSSGT